ncbi:putative hydroxypyruvate isomerase [Bombyx mandarina]|uniref:Putative hydroxypyruvate isomerase n=1 Tax=Bombyx mandarina TaxID=7092 RepID=A0A6J2JN84_BOMMA|nr:putative hydroxypyruvate isomerase [Bombyx mandarina]
MKFCANLSFMFAEASSILERYALAKDAGFKAVESGFPFGFSLEQVRNAKQSAGLQQIAINLKTGDTTKGEVGVTSVPGKEDEFKTNLNTTIEYAKALDAKKIHIMAGKVENPTPKHWETFEKNLLYAVDVLKGENIQGLIEPINQYSMPKYFLSDYGRAVDIIKRIDSPNLRLMLDIFHLQQIAGDITHNITKLLPYIGHVQIAQVPNRNEPDTHGEINYKYVLEHLAKSGYDEWVGLEYKAIGNTKDGLTWINNYGYSL